MARRNPDKVSRYASVADYDSDEGEELPETRKQANVAAKRTLSPIVDLSNDSGYSQIAQASYEATSSDSWIEIPAISDRAGEDEEIKTVLSLPSPRTARTESVSEQSEYQSDQPKHKSRRSKPILSTSQLPISRATSSKISIEESEKPEGQTDQPEHQRFRHPLTPEGQLLRYSIELGLDHRPKTIVIPSKRFGTWSSQPKKIAGAVESVEILGSTIVLDRDREFLSLVESKGRSDTPAQSSLRRGRLRWVHIHSDPMDFNSFKDSILEGQLRLDGATTKVAQALLHKVQFEHRIESSNFIIDPGIVLRCDGTDRNQQTRKDVTAIFIAFPFLTTGRPQSFAPTTDLKHCTRSQDIGLLNYFYTINRNPERDLEQTFYKLSSSSTRDIVKVSQTWALILNGEILFTCSSSPLSSILGSQIIRIIDGAVHKDAEQLVQIIDFWGRQFFLSTSTCRSYYSLKKSIAETVLADMSVSIDDCQLFLSDGALLTAVLWLNKLKEKTSGILCLRVLRTNLPGSTVIENSNYFTYPVVQHHPSAVIPGMGLRSNHENILVHHLGNPHALSHSQTENLGTFDSRLETNADGLIVNSSQPWKLKTQTKPAVVEFSNNPEDDIEESSDIQGTLTGFEIGLPSHSVRHISQISQTPRPTLRMTQHNMMSNKNVNGQHLLETKQLDLQSQRGRISQTTSRPDQLSIRNSSFWRSSSDGDVPTKTFRVASAKSMKVEEQESEAGQQRHMARDGQIRSYTAPIVAPLDEGDAAVSQQPAGSNDVDILADKKAGVTSRMNGIKMAQNKKQGENETNGPKEKAKDDEVEQKAKKLEEDLAEQWSSAGIDGSDEESDSDAITELQQSKIHLKDTEKSQQNDTIEEPFLVSEHSQKHSDEAQSTSDEETQANSSGGGEFHTGRSGRQTLLEEMYLTLSSTKGKYVEGDQNNNKHIELQFPVDDTERIATSMAQLDRAISIISGKGATPLAHPPNPTVKEDITLFNTPSSTFPFYYHAALVYFGLSWTSQRFGLEVFQQMSRAELSLLHDYTRMKHSLQYIDRPLNDYSYSVPGHWQDARAQSWRRDSQRRMGAPLSENHLTADCVNVPGMIRMFDASPTLSEATSRLPPEFAQSPFLSWAATKKSKSTKTPRDTSQSQEAPGLDYCLKLLHQQLSIASSNDKLEWSTDGSNEWTGLSLAHMYHSGTTCTYREMTGVMSSIDEMTRELSRVDSRGHFLALLVLYEIRTCVATYVDLLACFIPFFDDSIVAQKWRGALCGMLLTVANAAYFIVQDNMPIIDFGDKTLWFISDMMIRDLDLAAYEVQRPENPISHCRDCREAKGYESFEDCLSHFQKFHLMGQETPSPDLNPSTLTSMCFWIRTFRQLRAERWAFAILEHTRAFAHTARALLSKAQIIHESVLVDGGIKGECFILPESLLLALRRSMHHLILSYRGLVALTQLFTSPHNGNRSNGSDANEETEYLQEYLIRLEKVSKDAMTLFNEADEDLKSMAHPEDDHVARKYCAAGIESILICALTGLLDRPLAGYLSYTQPFDQQLTAIRYEITQHPHKRLMRELFTLQQELDAIRNVTECQERCFQYFREILDPDTYKITDQSRVSAYKVESTILESSIRRSDRDILHLERLKRDLNDTLHVGKYSLEILEEDHGKAIRLFTVVTVVFLPLTFVATVLGMNTADIRNMDRNQVLYWEIALPLTAIVILVAWVVSSEDWNLQGRWYRYKRRSLLKRSAAPTGLPLSEHIAEQDVSERLGKGYGISRIPGALMRSPPTWSVLSPRSTTKYQTSRS